MDRATGGGRGIPLSSFFLLIAVCSLLAALTTPVGRVLVKGDLPLIELAAAVVGGALGMMVLGAVVGLHHYRPVRGAAWGMLVGGLLGCLGGPLVVSPVADLPALTATVLGGAVIVVAVAAFLGGTARPMLNEPGE